MAWKGGRYVCVGGGGGGVEEEGRVSEMRRIWVRWAECGV